MATINSTQYKGIYNKEENKTYIHRYTYVGEIGDRLTRHEICGVYDGKPSRTKTIDPLNWNIMDKYGYYIQVRDEADR